MDLQILDKAYYTVGALDPQAGISRGTPNTKRCCRNPIECPTGAVDGTELTYAYDMAVVQMRCKQGAGRHRAYIRGNIGVGPISSVARVPSAFLLTSAQSSNRYRFYLPIYDFRPTSARFRFAGWVAIIHVFQVMDVYTESLGNVVQSKSNITLSLA